MAAECTIRWPAHRQDSTQTLQPVLAQIYPTLRRIPVRMDLERLARHVLPVPCVLVDSVCGLVLASGPLAPPVAVCRPAHSRKHQSGVQAGGEGRVAALRRVGLAISVVHSSALLVRVPTTQQMKARAQPALSLPGSGIPTVDCYFCLLGCWGLLLLSA